MASFFKCDRCRKFCLWGGLDEGGKRYCGIPCRDAAAGRKTGFCAACVEQAKDKEPYTGFAWVNLVGTNVMGSSDPCATCGSVISTKWFMIGLPVVPLASYRIWQASGYKPMGFRVPLHRPQLLPAYALWPLAAALIGAALLVVQWRMRR
jgi:hypothetical protein